MEKEPLDFLIAEGSEVNRTDIFGYDVNWLNIQGETALTLSLERIELDIANLLLDNGAVLYKN